MTRKAELLTALTEAKSKIITLEAELAKVNQNKYGPPAKKYDGEKPEWAKEIVHDEFGTKAIVYIEHEGRSCNFNMRWIPPGTDTLGSPADEPNRDTDEDQYDWTTITGFWMLETPVTQQLYKTITGEEPSYFKEDTRPVESISLLDAHLFCALLAKKLGVVVQPPSESEWEYAARAGTNGPTYGPLADIAVINSSTTAPVGTKDPNPWGLYDMLGNVWEWTRSAYTKNRIPFQD